MSPSVTWTFLSTPGSERAFSGRRAFSDTWPRRLDFRSSARCHAWATGSLRYHPEDGHESQRVPPDAAPRAARRTSSSATPSVWVTPPWWELADARRVGQYYNWTLDELLVRGPGRVRRGVHQRAPPERLRVHAEPQPHGQRAGQADQRPRRGHRADGHDAADHLAADPGGRGVRHARLHQRRPARRRAAARQPDGRQPRLRHHPDGAPRALSRGVRARAEGVAGEGDLRVEREVLPARPGQPLAAADAGAAPAGVGAGLGQHQHLRLRDRAQRLLLLPHLRGRPRRHAR